MIYLHSFYSLPLFFTDNIRHFYTALFPTLLHWRYSFSPFYSAYLTSIKHLTQGPGSLILSIRPIRSLYSNACQRMIRFLESIHNGKLIYGHASSNLTRRDRLF